VIKKNYGLIEFSNKEHSIPTLFGIAILSSITVLISTLSTTNARLTFQQILYKKNVKSALRRVAWYLRRSWMRIDLIDDRNFDFTEDLSVQEIESVNNFLLRWKQKSLSAIYHADRLYILTHIIHENARNSIYDHQMISTFLQSANTLLSHCLNHTSQRSTTKKTDQEKVSGTFKKDATEILNLFAQHLPNSRFPWYVISGTFLGLHRENDFLEHDTDLDFGINANDVDIESFIQALRDLPNITIKNITNIPEIYLHNAKITYSERLGIIKLLHTSGIQIDIFIHYLIDNQIVHGSRIHLWKNTPYGLTTRTLAGVKVLCPDNPDQYLTENYGHWQIPVTDFHSSIDTNNMMITPNFFSIAFFLRKLQTHIQNEEYIAYEKAFKILEKHRIIQNKNIHLPFLDQ